MMVNIEQLLSGPDNSSSNPMSQKLTHGRNLGTSPIQPQVFFLFFLFAEKSRILKITIAHT